MNKKLVFWSVTVALGGLLFGMDVANISGAEQRIQKLWNLSDWMHGTAIAMALYGTILGAAGGGIPANRFGRKKTLILIGIVFFVSALGSALANDVYTFMAFRFLGGLSIGASSVVAPVYISEIAPPQHACVKRVVFICHIHLFFFEDGINPFVQTKIVHIS
jgi:MFS transporter, SP family, arabinose:H+ symporter